MRHRMERNVCRLAAGAGYPDGPLTAGRRDIRTAAHADSKNELKFGGVR